MEIKIIIATHKACPMPEDPLYLPVHAGTACHDYTLPFTGDNTGANISEKNPNYCELTALYWAWKNVQADCIGLCHYRRYFRGKGGILTGEEARALMEGNSIVLPRRRSYWIETNYSQYIHAHHPEDLALTRQILEEQNASGSCMPYLTAYDKVMQQTHGHRFNMLLMRREMLDAYCTWLFDILFRLEARLDISQYDPYSRRVFGFVSERLLDVWITANGLPYREVPCLFTEKVNWPKKIAAFLKRKFRPTY